MDIVDNVEYLLELKELKDQVDIVLQGGVLTGVVGVEGTGGQSRHGGALRRVQGVHGSSTRTLIKKYFLQGVVCKV